MIIISIQIGVNSDAYLEPFHGSHDLFVPRSDLFPMNPEKKTLIP